jgi:hypothetical protein
MNIETEITSSIKPAINENIRWALESGLARWLRLTYNGFDSCIRLTNILLINKLS